MTQDILIDASVQHAQFEVKKNVLKIVNCCHRLK